jgi:hypothetical protein
MELEPSPWFKLDLNNFNDPWWLQSDIKDTNYAAIYKNQEDVLCHFIIQDTNNMGHIFYRFSTWYQNDPNRYAYINYSNEWIFNKRLKDMKEGDIVTGSNMAFKVFNTPFGNEYQSQFCKILVSTPPLKKVVPNMMPI